MCLPTRCVEAKLPVQTLAAKTTHQTNITQRGHSIRQDIAADKSAAAAAAAAGRTQKQQQTGHSSRAERRLKRRTQVSGAEPFPIIRLSTAACPTMRDPVEWHTRKTELAEWIANVCHHRGVWEQETPQETPTRA